MKPNEKNTIVGLLVFILVLLVVAGGIFNDISFSVSGKAIDKIKSKYFVFEEKAVDKLQNFENNLETSVDEFYQDVDNVEKEIVGGFEGFADGFVSNYELEIEQEFKELIKEENLEEFEEFEEEIGKLPEIVCSEDYYNCSDFNFTYESFVVFEVCGGIENDIHLLDGDGNGLACEGII